MIAKDFLKNNMSIQSSRQILIEKYIPPTEIDEEGNKFWYNKYRELHSFNGQHSCVLYLKNLGIVQENWYKNGKYIATKYYGLTESFFISCTEIY